MSVTMTKVEGVTVLTVTNINPKSNWPLLCQILGTLCYSPACSVSHKLRGLLGGTQSALGTIQIMIGLLNIGFGAILHASYSTYNVVTESGASYWLGGLFILCGVLCILAEKCPSACLVFITGLMNIVMWEGMGIIMIIFAALQLCIAISASVVAFKAVCKRDTPVQDPELNKPLVDEVLSYPTV
ncbi:uncharacterized protein LOC125305861 isoform X2 [Alosa alosa]|uniref:uncharacterized protein LOC125305861 isoform X2 n=1 Tax=Alosa alosa TaxID=278164 RepID=UPI0020153394|nr:uncharacterized protein LOC125305861 isoform X2 [Alosa alosa]